MLSYTTNYGANVDPKKWWKTSSYGSMTVSRLTYLKYVASSSPPPIPPPRFNLLIRPFCLLLLTHLYRQCGPDRLSRPLCHLHMQCLFSPPPPSSPRPRSNPPTVPTPPHPHLSASMSSIDSSVDSLLVRLNHLTNLQFCLIDDVVAICWEEERVIPQMSNLSYFFL